MSSDDKHTRGNAAGLRALVATKGGGALLEQGPSALAKHQKAEQDPNAADLTADEEAAAEGALAMFEAAFLVAAADGELHDAETEQLAVILTELAGGQLGPTDFEEILESFVELLEDEGFEGRARAIGETLTDPEARRAAFVLACGITYLDRTIDEREETVFGSLATALEIPDDEALALLEQVEAELGVRPG